MDFYVSTFFSFLVLRLLKIGFVVKRRNMQSRVIFDKDLAFYAKIMWHEPNFGKKFLHTLICNSNQRKRKPHINSRRIP